MIIRFLKRKLLELLVSAYIWISIIASAAVSAGVFDYEWIVQHRSPFLLLEFRFCTPDHIRYDGQADGYDHKGHYICYDEGDLGKDFLSILVWNPANNYEDDIMARFDFEL